MKVLKTCICLAEVKLAFEVWPLRAQQLLTNASRHMASSCAGD